MMNYLRRASHVVEFKEDRLLKVTFHAEQTRLKIFITKPRSGLGMS